MTPVAGVILCGGRSTRMGRDKAALEWQGQSWLDHSAQRLRDSGLSHIYVSGQRDQYDCLPDPVAGLGPAAGICHCVAALSGRYAAALFLPVDMPLLQSDSLRLLANGLTDGQGAIFADSPLPLCLRLDATVRAHCQAFGAAMTDGGPRSVRALIAPLRLHRLTVPDPETLRNFNRPEDII